jgi:hypothetical protein
MKISKIDIDSKVMGGAVLSLSELSETDDFSVEEQRYIATYNPVYTFCKIPIEELSLLHHLESNGFRLVEIQLRLSRKVAKPYDIPPSQYSFEQVTTESVLKDVLDIAATTFTIDRIYNDPKFPDAENKASQRYVAYVKNSFAAEDERVFRMLDTTSGETVAFRTHRLLANSQALCLLGGIRQDLQCAGLGPLHVQYEHNHFYKRGVKRFTTHVSARNYGIMNLEIGGFRFRIQQTFAVLRKYYPLETTTNH